MKDDICTTCKLDDDYGMVKIVDTISCFKNTEMSTANCAAYNPIPDTASKATAVCNQCQFGYMYNSGTKVCDPVIKNCIAFSWTVNPLNARRIYCTDCLPGSRINYYTG